MPLPQTKKVGSTTLTLHEYFPTKEMAEAEARYYRTRGYPTYVHAYLTFDYGSQKQETHYAVYVGKKKRSEEHPKGSFFGKSAV